MVVISNFGLQTALFLSISYIPFERKIATCEHAIDGLGEKPKFNNEHEERRKSK